MFSFCSAQHQSLHEEEGRCLPFTVATRDMVGRCAVATRDIQPGELIFRCQGIMGIFIMGNLMIGEGFYTFNFYFHPQRGGSVGGT